MESEIVLGEICLRTIYLHNIVMTPVWVSGRYGESCESTVDCDSTVECMNNKAKRKMSRLQLRSGARSPGALERTVCGIDKDGKWY